jgi:hypothetical protein
MPVHDIDLFYSMILLFFKCKLDLKTTFNWKSKCFPKLEQKQNIGCLIEDKRNIKEKSSKIQYKNK